MGEASESLCLELASMTAKSDEDIDFPTYLKLQDKTGRMLSEVDFTYRLSRGLE